MERPPRLGLGWALVAVLATGANAHAILLGPGLNPQAADGARELGITGVKLQPFNDAEKIANEGCGGTINVEPGTLLPGGQLAQNVIGNGLPTPAPGNNDDPAYPSIVTRPGSQLNIVWRATIPHDIDVTDTGVRISIHYGPGDSFKDNVLLGGVGGGRFVDGTGDSGDPTPAHPIGAGPNTGVQRLVTLPEDKVCAFCTLQFLWAARNDGGFYLGCVDLSITADGQRPNFAQLVAGDPDLQQVGKEISDVRTRVGADGVVEIVAADDDGGSQAGPVAAGVIIGLLALGVICFCLYKRSKGGGGPFLSKTPPPPGGGLPPGWASAVDPASGRNYFVNSATGQTSWEPPVGEPAAKVPPPGAVPPPPGPPGGSLPAGWTATTDPASGQTYYVNSITGVTQWEAPACRV